MTSDRRLLSILEMLEQCRAGLLASGNRDSAHLVSVAILDVKMRVHRIADTELKALCDEILAEDGAARPRESKVASGRRRRPLLRVVK